MAKIRGSRMPFRESEPTTTANRTRRGCRLKSQYGLGVHETAPWPLMWRSSAWTIVVVDASNQKKQLSN